MSRELTEVLSRTRRVETRLTQLMIALGVDTRSQKPKFRVGDTNSAARIDLPSPHSSLCEAVEAVPEGWRGPIDVYVGENRITTLDHGA